MIDEQILQTEFAIVGNIILDFDNDPGLMDPARFQFPEIRQLFNLAAEARAQKDPTWHILQSIDELGLDTNLHDRATDAGVIKANYEANIQAHQRLSRIKRLNDLGRVLMTATPATVETALESLEKEFDKNESEKKTRFGIVNPAEMDLDLGDSDPAAYVPTGFETVDRYLNDLARKQVTLVAGRSSEGKSTMIRQLIANAIDKQHRVLWMIGESTIEAEMQRFYEIVCGRDEKLYKLEQINKIIVKLPNDEAMKGLRRWMGGNLKLLHKTDARLRSTDELFRAIESELRRSKPQLVVIDNLMSFLNASALEKNEAQSAFMQRLCDIARLHGCHIILVLHPNKSYKPGEQLEFENISGSSDLYNKADIVLTIRRATEDDLKKNPHINGWIGIVKNRKWGKLKSVPINFDHETKSFSEIDETGRVKRRKFDIQRFMDKELKFYNGTTQTIEPGNGW